MTSPTTVPVKMAQRRDTAANWTSVNPTLLAGEIGLESDTGYWKVGNGSTAWVSLPYVTGLGGEIPVSRLADGTARQLLQTAANGTDVEWTSNVDVPGTLDVTGAATFDAAVTIQGDLTVNGTTTTIDTQNLIVEDKNVIIGNVTTPTDVTADGGGITLKGTTDKTINWVDATDAWTLSEHVNIASGKEYRIAGTKVLDATSLGSSVLITSANITDGTIVNGDVNDSAAIAGTKVSPDFGSQNVTTTGTSTAASFIPSSSTAPTNGVYLPATNSVAISTNSTGRLFIDSSGRVGVGASPTGDLDVSRTSATVEIRGTSNTSGDVRFGFVNTGANYSWIQAERNSGSLQLATNNTERLRITSAGLVGIGTTAPVNTLDVNGGIGVLYDQGLQLFRQTGTVNNKIISHSYSGGDILSIAPAGDDPSSVIRFQTASGSSLAERARIDSSGRLGLGTSSPSSNFQIVTSALTNIPSAGSTGHMFALGTNPYGLGIGTLSSGNNYLQSTRFDGTATNYNIFLNPNGGEVLVAGTTDQGAYNLQCNGTGVWGAGAYVNGSDERLKENIQDIEPALEIIKAMRPVTFKYKKEYSRDQSTQPGFIAQELQQALAETAYLDGIVQAGPEYLNVAYQGIIAVLVKAVQELEAKVAALESA